MPITSRAGTSRSAGFTYVGLLILVAIIAMAGAATLSVGQVVQRRSAEEELLYVGKQFKLAFKRYHDNTPLGKRPYPAELQDLVLDTRFPKPVRHIRRLYADPITGKADWQTIPAPGGGIMGVASRSEAAPIKIGNFPLEWESLAGKERYADWQFAYNPQANLLNPNGGAMPNAPGTQPVSNTGFGK